MRIMAPAESGALFHQHHCDSWCILCVVMQDGFLQRIADLTFAVAIPVHMHIGMNALVTDYLPKVARGELLAQSTLRLPAEGLDSKPGSKEQCLQLCSFIACRVSQAHPVFQQHASAP